MNHEPSFWMQLPKGRDGDKVSTRLQADPILNWTIRPILAVAAHGTDIP